MDDFEFSENYFVSEFMKIDGWYFHGIIFNIFINYTTDFSIFASITLLSSSVLFFFTF